MGKKPLRRKLLWVFCPLATGQSFEEFIKVAELFPTRKASSIFKLLCIYIFYFLFIADGLLYPFIDTHFLLLPRASLGPFLNAIHIMCGAAICEIVVLRSYCIYTKIRHGINSIGWFNILTKITSDEHRKLFLFLRFLFFQMGFSVTIIYLSNHLTKLVFERSTPIDYFVNAVWIVSEMLLIRFTIIEIPLMYVMSYSCYVYVNQKLDKLIGELKRPQINTILVIVRYKNLVKLIMDANPLVKLISSTNGVTVIPYISLAIMVAITDTENQVQLIIKYAYLVPASIYSIRGVVITAIIAKIDSKSRILHKLITSQIARGHVKGFIPCSKLITIMEDLACSKNHICMREFSGSPSNQIDILQNVVSIAQFVMLLREFGTQLNS